MPARSRSQQRLFGMVHAFNKGELHGSKSLMRRISNLSQHISDRDARHFAKTPHEGLPEKTAQMVLRPDELRALYEQIPPGAYAGLVPTRSEQRRGFLGSIVHGASVGAVAGGAGLGAIGLLMAYQASKHNPAASRLDLLSRMGKAGLKCGLLGVGKGAVAGSVVGAGLNVFDRLRS